MKRSPTHCLQGVPRTVPRTVPRPSLDRPYRPYENPRVLPDLSHAALPAHGLKQQLSERHFRLRPGMPASSRSSHADPSTAAPLGEAACSSCQTTGKQRPPPWARAALRLGYLAGLSAIEHETAAADGLLALPLDGRRSHMHYTQCPHHAMPLILRIPRFLGNAARGYRGPPRAK